MENKDLYIKEVKLFGIPLFPKKAKDISIGSVATKPGTNESFFVTEALKKVEEQLELNTGNFILKDFFMVDLYGVSEETIAPGELCIVFNKNQEAANLVYYKMPDHDAIRSNNSKNDVELKIIISPDMFGCVGYEDGGVVILEIKHINQIVANNGKFLVEMENNEPKLLNGKAIIHINEKI